MVETRLIESLGCSGTWHHPLIALEEGDYLVIDHAGAGPSFDQDYEEVLFAPGELTLQF